MKKLFLASVALVAFSSMAAAADLASYTKAPPAAFNPGVNWSGFYIVPVGGYGWSDRLRVTALGVGASTNTSDVNGGFGGGTIGYNWQINQGGIALGGDAA